MSSDDRIWKEFIAARESELVNMKMPKRTLTAMIGGIVGIILAWAAVFASVGVAVIAFRWMASQF